MPSQESSSLSILLLDPRRHRSHRYLQSIGETPGIALIGSARDLTEAYNLTEHEHPDLVLIAEEVTRLGNFPMYAAMLAALEVDCILIAAGLRPASGPYTSITDVDVDRAGGLGPYLGTRFGLRRQPVQPCVLPNPRMSSTSSEKWAGLGHFPRSSVLSAKTNSS